MNTLIVDVLPLRTEGWILPRHRLAFLRPYRGILIISDDMIEDWHRHARTAKLIAPETNKALSEPRPLHDVLCLRATPFEWILAGVERISDGLRSVDVAQTWRVDPVEVR